MIFPYENYLNLLLARGLDDAAIFDRLEFYNLVTPDREELDDKRSEIESKFPPNTFVDYPLKDKEILQVATDHEAVIRSLDLEEVLPTLKGIRVKHWEDALAIMCDKKIRTTVQSLMILGEAPATVQEKIKNMYKLNVDLQGLAILQKYFWNIVKMDRRELYGYISALPNSKYRDTLANALYGQKKAISWAALGENSLSLEEVLVTIMNESFSKFQEYVNSKDPEKQEAAMRWANMAIKTSEKFKRGISGSDDVLRNLKITLETVKQSELPMLDSKDVI